ncbi:MAG TPA: MFS transporter [Pseudonocardiaceae bacterium]|jgi:EmrB/QacA subfamily drug resistance transporter
MSTTTTLSTPQARARTGGHGWTLALASVGSFLVVLDLFAVSTALPTLRVDLHANITTLDWIINAYTLTFAVLLMAAAALGDRWGRRAAYLAGLLLFAAASAACALAGNGAELVAARAVQGVGAALIMATALALINAAFPAERRGWAMGVYGAVTGIATTLGPVLGGVITELLGWSSIFWINVPIAVVAAVCVALRIRDGRTRAVADRLDLSGLALGGAAVLVLVWAVIRAADIGWGDGLVIAALGLGVALLAALIVRLRRARHPLIPLRLFADAQFSSGVVGIFLLTASVTAVVFFTAQFLQNGQGDGPLAAGLHLLPLGVVPLVLGMRSGAYADRIGTRPMILLGLILQGIGITIIAVLGGTGLPYPVLGVAMAITAAGFTCAVPALTKSVVGSVPPADIGTASGLFTTVRQVGGAFGVAAASAAFSASGGYGTPAAVAAGYRAAMIVAALAVLIALAANIRIRKDRS